MTTAHLSEFVVEATEIQTRFGDNQVHSGINLRVPRGKIVGVIGVSGSGKTVLLREIVGLLRPTSGHITVLGVDMWSSSPAEVSGVKERFGVLFQNGALFSAISVGENVAVPLVENSDLPSALVTRLVELRLSMSGLEPKVALMMPSELSGGMRKRAALARALALEPELLFLDEPTSGLDPINARAFDHLVRTLCDNLGLTIVMVTHDLDTLLGITDEIIAIGDGRVLAQGPVAQVAAVDHPWIREYFDSRLSSNRR